MTTEIIRSAEKFKRLHRTAREALRAVRDLERVQDDDLFGRYVLDEHEELDDENLDEVAELLHLARQTYPTQRLDIIVMAHLGVDKEARNGHHAGEVQRH